MELQTEILEPGSLEWMRTRAMRVYYHPSLLAHLEELRINRQAKIVTLESGQYEIKLETQRQ